MGFYMDKLFPSSEMVLFSNLDLLFAMTIAAMLSFVLCFVYRETHRGTSYSQSFLVTMIVMSVSTGVVMMIIGSNIARAFSLIGALSIVRFRTAVKDGRDTAFLFAAIVVGMACGTHFYMAGIILTAFISILLLLLDRFNFGVKERLEKIVRISFENKKEIEAEVERILETSFRDFKKINRIVDLGEGYVTNVYVVRPGAEKDSRKIEENIGKIKEIRTVAVYESDQHAPF